MKGNNKEYLYTSAEPTWANAYLWPVLQRHLELKGGELFDLGCGNGATAGMLSRLGYDVTGIDPSVSGIAQASAAYPKCRFEVASAYDDLCRKYGNFPLVVSLEVVEHLYDPRLYARTLFDLVEPGGRAIVSTPYHGYLKNIALAVTGRMDKHFTALWDGGQSNSFRSLRSVHCWARQASRRSGSCE